MIDSWDVLSFDRPYSPAMNREEVFAFLKKEAGNSFRPDLLEKFLMFLERYTAGEAEAEEDEDQE